MDRTYQSIRKIQRAGITCKMIDKHFPTRYNKCRWNVCFIFSLREIKYDEHKVKMLLFIAAYQKKIETNNMKLMIVTVFKIKNPC